MRLSWYVITCSITACSLSSKDDLRPRIVLPVNGKPTCIIGNDDCFQPLREVQRYVIFVLNVERFRVATGHSRKLPIATDMLSMETDEELTATSQAYAETCLIKNNMQSCSPPGDYQAGEVSVFVTEYERDTKDDASMRAAKVLTEYRSAMQDYSEKELEQYVKEYMPQETKPVFNNLAKFIHSDVWMIGCGFADFLIPNNKFKEVLVCFYGPPKLEIGNQLYIAGCVPCSNCPGETLCTERNLKGLCKVNSGKLPLYEKRKKWEKKICLQPEKPSLNANPLWYGKQENDAQQCRGTNLCSSGWLYENDHAYIELDKICLATAAFKTMIYIEKHSCFTFYYRKGITTFSPNAASIIAFAFKDDDQSIGTKKEIKYGESETDFKPIHLDLPWSNTYIHVGFGTQSDKENEWYEMEVKNFIIKTRPCPQD